MRRQLAFFASALLIGSYLPSTAKATGATLGAIASALANTSICPAGGSCVIQLDCGAGTIDTTGVSSDTARVSFGSQKNVRIQGCGIDATTVEWDTTVSSSSANYEMFDINTPSSGTGGGIVFQDMTLVLKSSCTSCGAKGAIARVRGNVQNVKFERVHFVLGQGDSTMGVGFPAAVYAVSDGTTRPKNVSVLSSKIETVGGGVNLFDCDECWVNGSYFEALSGAGVSPYALAIVSHGDAIRLVNNSFDMAGTAPSTDGLRLDSLGSSTPGSGAQLIANTFYNLSITGTPTALLIKGYNDAIINANRFRCDVGFLDFGCPPALSTQTGCSGCNKRNIISNNVFDRFYDDASSLCPIYMNGGDSQGSIVGNMFVIYAAGSGPTGVCGSGTALKADNNIVSSP
jgi:hypothetical protein